jgi:excisionase family DNA binding protein
MSTEPVMSPLRVTVAQAAAALSISQAYAYRIIDNGKLKAVIDGGRRYVLVEELQRYIAALEVVEPTYATPLARKPTGRPPRKSASTAAA